MACNGGCRHRSTSYFSYRGSCAMKRLLLALFTTAAVCVLVPSTALAVNPHEVPSTPEHGRVDFDGTTAAAECPPGLVPVVGEEATISVFSAATGALLFTTTVPITE